MGHRHRIAAALALAGAAVIVGAPGGRAVLRLHRSWGSRVAVDGDSMRPLLLPGDWLLVDPRGFMVRGPATGDLVVVPDPRMPEHWLVKRVQSVEMDGRLDVRGDASGASTDSRSFGALDPDTVVGRPWLRYWPMPRAGLID
jgi:nickel-type superoxide dismutase maturation protease